MSSTKRECATCQFFQNAQLAGNGWCTHPNRQLASDVRLLVRARELACRNSWGDDLWVDKESPATTPAAPTPRSGGMIYVATHADDEVTSVVDTTARDAASTLGRGQQGADDQVTHTSVRSDLPAAARRDALDPNTPANDDQDDRVRMMARGSRDAILRARERHVQRRTPTRPQIEPKASDIDPDGDQVIESQDRQHYDPPTDRNTQPLSSGAGPELEHTPPVPREEVQEKGTGLSPAVGPDVRFDSVPEVKADIELPRLRQFLHGSQAHTTSEPPTPTQLPDVSVSSYDLVLRRAREIKASTPGEPLPPRSAPTRQSPPSQQHEPGTESAGPRPNMPTPGATQVSPEAPTVVWDLDPEDIRVAFQRVREAIDQPLPKRLAPPAGSVTQRDILPPPETAQSRGSASYVGGDIYSSDDEALQDPDPDDGASSYARSPEPESPRGSWWRSLNFGIRRRITLAPPPELPREFEADDADTVSYEPVEFIYDDASLEPAHEAVDSWDEYDVTSFTDVHDNQELPGGYDPFGASGERQRADAHYLATSEESWLEDELEFPEPQPAEWHETRAAMLAHRPPPQDDTVPPAMPEPNQPIADRGPATVPVAASLAVPTPRQPPPYFAIDQPGGMNAFRAALFGDGESDTGETDGDFSMPVQTSAAAPSAVPGPKRDWLAHSPGNSMVEASFNSPPWWQHPGPARPSGRFERGSQLDIPDEILERDDGPRTFDVASRVPKCCRTCRSFRPSDHRDQGWCMNGDAFTHRQMVNADTLSCRSSIGDWWLAADQSWIPPEDVIRPETPRTDRLMERQDLQNEPSPQDGRRVRTRRAV